MRGALFPALLIATAATAAADDAIRSRVLVVDQDPELVRAIERSLAPWRLTVISEPPPPDAALVATRADAADARFVVWREGEQLVVFDRERGTTERRTAHAGAFDPVAAAAAALTVKTMMRLPPDPATGLDAPSEQASDDPSATTTTTTAITATTTATSAGPTLRLQTQLGGRLARGSQTDVGARVALAVFVRPVRTRGWRLGVAGELGTAPAVEEAGFKGTWSDWSALGVASWTYQPGAVALEPSLGAGVVRSALDGTEMMGAPRTERATLGLVRAGVTVRWSLGAWSVGVYAAFDATLGTPTYIKQNQGMGMGSNTIFEVPSFAGVLGAVAAVDLGR